MGSPPRRLWILEGLIRRAYARRLRYQLRGLTCSLVRGVEWCGGPRSLVVFSSGRRQGGHEGIGVLKIRGPHPL